MRLIHGECLEEMAKLADGCVDLVLADPPYGKTVLDWDKHIDVKKMWAEYDRICTGPVILMAMQPFTTLVINSNMKDFRYSLVWSKGKGSNPLLANKQPMRSHEDVCVFYKKQPIYNPQMREGTPYVVPRTGGNRTNSIVGATKDKAGFKQQTKDTSKRYPLSVMEYSIHCGSKLHPTQKPVQLMEYLIRTYTNPRMTVLDNCMGAGTTGIACVNTNRNFIGIEQDEKYFEVARTRIEGGTQ